MIALPSNPDLASASATDAAETARDERYLEAAALYGAPLERMARAYEADPSRRQDLLQDVHVAIWRSLLTSMAVVLCVPGYTAWLTTPRPSTF